MEKISLLLRKDAGKKQALLLPIDILNLDMTPGTTAVTSSP